MSVTPPLSAAVIGMGPHGRRVVDVLLDFPNVRLSSVVDRRPEALAYEKLPTATARLLDLEQLWQQGSVDLVCIVTNGPSHASLAEEAIAHGVKYVMISKPLACSLQECDQIIAAAANAGVRVAVDHVRRYAPVYLWLRDQIATGRWGTPRCIWMQRPGIGLGCNATHSFDAIRMLTGREVESVSGWVDEPRGPNPRGADFVDPGGLAILEMTGGLRAIVAQIEDGAGPTTVEIDLTGGRIRMDERSGEIEIVERDLSVKPGPGRPPAYRPGEVPAGLTAKVDMFVGLRGLLNELTEDGSMACDAQQGRASIAVLAATHLSHRRGHALVSLSKLDVELNDLWLPVT